MEYASLEKGRDSLTQCLVTDYYGNNDKQINQSDGDKTVQKTGNDKQNNSACVQSIFKILTIILLLCTIVLGIFVYKLHCEQVYSYHDTKWLRRAFSGNTNSHVKGGLNIDGRVGIF